MISLIVFVLLACLAVYIYHGLQAPLTVTTYNYHNKKIPSAFSDYTIVQISDLHCKNFGKNQSELISKIKAAKPDMIALTGDIVDEDHDSISSVEDLLKGIKDLGIEFILLPEIMSLPLLLQPVSGAFSSLSKIRCH